MYAHGMGTMIEPSALWHPGKVTHRGRPAQEIAGVETLRPGPSPRHGVPAAAGPRHRVLPEDPSKDGDT